MTERVLGEKGSKRRKRFLVFPVLAIAVLALLWVAGAQAVHDEEFQLDGDVFASTLTHEPDPPGTATQSIDWDTLFDSDGDEITPLPANFTESDFVKDFNNTGTTFINNDTTTFATGSKDTLPIADWQCNFDNNVNNKIDVVNSYAASYTDPDTGHDIIYFALERFTNTGDANVAFWFLQSNVDCASTGGAVDFMGAHTDGDLLVVSEFSNGGTVSTINVYEWVGDDATGSLNQTPVASGVDCRDLDPTDPDYELDDRACAAANTATLNNVPWLTAAFTADPKVGHTLPTAQFFEGGLDLTAVGLGDTCFNTFIGDTRSSTSLEATLFDFARGQLGSCETTVTSQQDWLPNDSANVTITGIAMWGGSLKFTLFPSLDCTGTPLYDPAAIDITQATTQPITTNNTSVKVTATANTSWEVDFTPNQASLDAGVEDPDPVCESTALTINNTATHG